MISYKKNCKSLNDMTYNINNQLLLYISPIYKTNAHNIVDNIINIFNNLDFLFFIT